MTETPDRTMVERVARAIMKSNLRDTHERLSSKGVTYVVPESKWPKIVDETWQDKYARIEALNAARAALSEGQ